jgi:hypothetical protein
MTNWCIGDEQGRATLRNLDQEYASRNIAIHDGFFAEGDFKLVKLQQLYC